MDLEINLKIFSLRRKVSISKRWIEFSIVAIAVFSSLLISYWGSMLAKVLVPFVLGSIAAILLIIKKLNIGFIYLFLAAMFVPFSGPGGVNAAVLMVVMIISLWMLNMFVVKQRFLVVRSRALLPVVVMFAISMVSFGMGQFPWFLFANQAPLDAQLGGFSIFMLSLGLMVATANLIQDIKWLEIIVWVFIGLGGIYVIGRSLHINVDRIYTYGFSAGSMFWTWLVALSSSQVFFNHKLRTSTKVTLYIILLFTFYTSIVQGYDWKSGWLPPLVVVAVILALKYPRLVILAVPFFLYMTGYLVNQMIASDEYSWGTRVDAWLIVLTISKASPLFGLGFANYYWYTPLYPIRGWAVSFNSHSQFVDLIAQVGILGLICFLWIFFEVGRLSWRLIKKLPNGFAQSYSYGVLAGVVGTLAAAFLVDWVLPFTYNIGFSGFRASILPWIFMGGLIGIENIYFGEKNL